MIGKLNGCKLIEDDDLLENYDNIRERVSVDIKERF